VDHCWHVRRLGYQVVDSPSSVAVHHESGSMGRRSPRYYFNFHRGRLRYLLKNVPLSSLATLPARELRWARQHGFTSTMKWPLLRAYATAIAALPIIIQRRLARRLRSRR
jgi:GT2 family glycosyltransferase